MNRIETVIGPRARFQLNVLKYGAANAAAVTGRGLQSATWAFGRLFDAGNRAVVRMPEGRITVYLDDGYWARLLLPDFRYETEIERTLRALLSGTSTCFLDCGANIGYWSVVASSDDLAASVVAVEASPWVADRLSENAALNFNRFEVVRAALWDKAGETLTIQSDVRQHAGGNVINEAAGRRPRSATVHTVTIDELVAEFFPDPNMPLVIKLDVEGAEIASLDGASAVLRDRSPAVIYEDHGNDPQHTVSAYVLNHLGLRVFATTPGGSLQGVTDLSELSALKTRRSKGYNFVACSDDSPSMATLQSLLVP